MAFTALGRVLKSGAIPLAVGNAAYAASQWIMFTMVARRLGAESLGLLALAFAITGPLQSLCNLSLRGLLAIDAITSEKLKTYVRLRLSSYIVFFLLIVPFVFYSPGSSRFLWAGMLITVSLLRFGEAIADLSLGGFIRGGEYQVPFASYIFRSISNATVFLFIFPIHGNILAALTGVGLINIVFVSRFDLARLERFYGVKKYSWFASFRNDPEVLVVFRRAIPLAMAHFFVLVQPNIPRYLLELTAGTAALGVFATMSLMIAMGNLPVTAACQAALPRLADAIRYNQPQVFRLVIIELTTISIVIGVAGILVSVFWGDDVMRMLFGDEFSIYGRYLPYMMAVAVLSYFSTIAGSAPIAIGSHRALAWGYAAVCGVSVVSGFVLIPPMGLTGAIFSLGTTFTASLVVASSIFLRRRQRLQQEGMEK